MERTSQVNPQHSLSLRTQLEVDKAIKVSEVVVVIAEEVKATVVILVVVVVEVAAVKAVPAEFVNFLTLHRAAQDRIAHSSTHQELT